MTKSIEHSRRHGSSDGPTREAVPEPGAAAVPSTQQPEGT